MQHQRGRICVWMQMRSDKLIDFNAISFVRLLCCGVICPRVVYQMLHLHLTNQIFGCFLASSTAVTNGKKVKINLISHKSCSNAIFLERTVRLPAL